MLYSLNFLLCSYVLTMNPLWSASLALKWHQIPFMGFTVGKRSYFTGYGILFHELPVVALLFISSNCKICKPWRIEFIPWSNSAYPQLIISGVSFEESLLECYEWYKLQWFSKTICLTFSIKRVKVWQSKQNLPFYLIIILMIYPLKLYN